MTYQRSNFVIAGDKLARLWELGLTLLTTLQRSLRLLSLTDMPDLNAGADRRGWRGQRFSSAVD